MEKIIKDILITLENKDYEAYIVGGFVRDYLCHKTTFDVDICTSALPQELKNILGKEPNIFGGLHFKAGQFDLTITSFRQDFNYHHGFPQEIVFTNNLDEDLKRRDFTINAICMDKNEKIIADPLYIKDLEARVIRMIGDPLARIKEDPSRIIRALRFKVDLDFSIEATLLEVIKENKHLLSNLSNTKINKELAKIKNKEKFHQLLQEINYI